MEGSEDETVRGGKGGTWGVKLAHLRLDIVEGPDRGASFDLSGTEQVRTYLGKSPNSTIQLNDPLISRRHCAFENAAGGMRFVDLNSLNGSRVNGIRVVELFLEGGETITLGGTTIKVVNEAPLEELVLTPAVRFGRMIGVSAELRRLFPLCRRLAKSDVPVILEGETGTGKEVLAEALHEASPRASGPFVVFDCTSVPPTLVESALFGHDRGAFTGAVGARQGVFEQADGGTLLIDEIGDLELALQAKLLRAIERSEIQRIGSNLWTKVNVRILCATRRDLEREITEGRFRDDLFYRLAVARIELPPLRRRQGDVPVLTRHFWEALGGDSASLTPQVLRRFEGYEWPGNIRELRNAVAHQIALGDLADPSSLHRPASARSIDTGLVPHVVKDVAAPGDVIDRAIADQLSYPRARHRVLSELDRRYCEWILARFNGNVSKAAAASGIARRYFYVIRARGSNPVE